MSKGNSLATVLRVCAVLTLAAVPALAHARTTRVCTIENGDGTTSLFAGIDNIFGAPTGGVFVDGEFWSFTGNIAALPSAVTNCVSVEATSPLRWLAVTVWAEDGSHTVTTTSGSYEAMVASATLTFGSMEPDAVVDDDEDGVEDDVDACLETALGDVVGDDGCSVEQLCPTTESWPNHGAYVSCVSHSAKELLWEGHITEAEKSAMVAGAARSGVGRR